MKDKLNDSLILLEQKIDSQIEFGKKLVETHALYTFDIFCTATLNRSINILRGYISLMRDNNFIAAAPLVRVHLDSLLRFYSTFLVDEDIDKYALRIIGGEQINKIKDRKGKLMRDSHLCAEFSSLPGKEWVNQVYKAGSGFIHLSNTATSSATTIRNEDNHTISMTIGKHDSFIPSDQKNGSAIFMLKITAELIELMERWRMQKQSYSSKTK
jgi:hypothetical protein